MYAKIKITGIIEVVTGLHIGGSSAFSAIGAVDSPVVRDTLSRRPIIPGSSLKGKMRTLLVREECQSVVLNEVEKDSKEIARLFGSTAKDENGHIIHSRLKFSDCQLSNAEALQKKDVPTFTEVKFENTINRLTAIANPRQIERVVKGAEFAFELIYDIESIEELEEDFNTLAKGFILIENDYLGGHGSRGSGRIKFKELKAAAAVPKPEDDLIGRCNEILKVIG